MSRNSKIKIKKIITYRWKSEYMDEHRFQWEVNVWRKGTEVGDFSHVSVCEGGDGRKQDLVCANHV